MSEFKPFEDRLNGLIAALSPAARRKLAGEIAKQLRAAQQQRIKQQKAPDGSPYKTRKRQPLRAKTGRIKRAMFQKLRTSRYMKASGRENSAVVEFTGKVQRIARVHQYGLRDRPRAYAEDVKYPQRQLLGLSDINIKEIELLVVKHISN
ncbi:phage virion morphogenesis protein [Enterobacter hormaechei]|jgi:phage virion morphogenesis protein|uniref:phage virion morphogenesis protein n=1 Tax=Enterobacter cloacae complex TaxID=354276 RepID=UPI000735B278|nr:MULTISPECIES: phage virion morphogenesis protein [Enterobacter cloacae complex]QLU72278.1 phage virion morphogenesis protein [Enterobacter cloacae]QLU92466.1 phage virion morphogenesis protein [Enterobacter roggenkampii]HCJ6305730.1 phage virion morphogenesis protein [Enterobacter hormaechei subsp. xiangfangensis]HED2447645.1 phage virion morphogenesis protein [Enterobacter hormaechei subsp. hoffmannii]KTI60702.1 phage tail protein [Enterobacter cloacae subsp. cloacae]